MPALTTPTPLTAHWPRYCRRRICATTPSTWSRAPGVGAAAIPPSTARYRFLSIGASTMSGTTSIVPAWLGGSLVMMRSTETLTCQIKCEVARGDDLNIEQAKVHAAKVLESVLSLLTFAVGMDRNPDQIAQAYEKHGVSAVILAPAA